MQNRFPLLFGLSCFCVLGLFAENSVRSQEKQQPDQLEKYRCPKPKELAIVFSFGYTADKMPKEDKKFEELLQKIKDGGFNVIHCTYSDKRLELCKKHGIRMMVDLLYEDYHVYKSPEKAKVLCEKLKNNPTVWGYNIWNDNIGKTSAGRKRDINAVRQWDPTHPAFVGTYRTSGMNSITNADIIGYYDFHWTRKRAYHFPHLLTFSKWATDRNAWFYCWAGATPGQLGKGNYNRALYTVNTSLACGLKGVMWFLGDNLMDQKTLEWSAAGNDIIKVNKKVAPLGSELLALGHPQGIYSTSISKTENNDPLPPGKKETMPPGLEKHGFPKEFWLQPKSGEFVVGVYEDGQKRKAAYFANHNAYVEQKVTLALEPGISASHFQCPLGKWVELPVQNNTITFSLAAADGELLRFEKK